MEKESYTKPNFTVIAIATEDIMTGSPGNGAGDDIFDGEIPKEITINNIPPQ